jgi:hypothetical protein
LHLNVHQADREAARAAAALGRTMLDRWLDRARRIYGGPPSVPGWSEAAGWSQMSLFMTPAETLAVSEEIRKLLGPYIDRRASPALRPPEAHPVEWTMFAMPIPEWTPDSKSPSPEPANEAQP